MVSLRSSCLNTKLKYLTDAGSPVGRQLESFVTVAHEGAVSVEAAVSAHRVFTLVHVCGNNSGQGVYRSSDPPRALMQCVRTRGRAP